jgi:O-antigen/teichoic acid export membrane protein
MIKIDKDFTEVLKKGGSALLIRIAGFLAGYLFIFYTVKFFGAETQGRLNLSFSFMMIGALICRLGLDIHFVKIYSIPGNFHNSKGIYYKVIPYVLVLTFLVSGCVFIFSKNISIYIFNDPELSIFLKWVSPCVIFFTFILLNASVFRGLKKNSLYAFLFNGGRFIFTLFFFFSLIIFYKNPLITIIAHTLAIFILFLISIRYILKYNFPFVRKSTYTSRKFVRQSLPMLISTSMIIFLGWSDTIVLGIFKDSSDVGIYGVVLKISVVTSFTFQALDSILAPKLSNAYHAKEMNLFKKLVKFSTILNSIISILVVVGIFLFKDLILSIFGDEFFKASTALIILCLGQLFNSICGPVGSILQMTGRQIVFRNILMIAFLINILLNFLLAPTYGINGVAIATAISLAFWNLSSVIYISKKIY